MGSRIIEIGLSISVAVVACHTIMVWLKLKAAIKALNETRQLLNETRQIVASQSKTLRKLSQN
jgi:hypothetical protein